MVTCNKDQNRHVYKEQVPTDTLCQRTPSRLRFEVFKIGGYDTSRTAWWCSTTDHGRDYTRVNLLCPLVWVERLNKW